MILFIIKHAFKMFYFKIYVLTTVVTGDNEVFIIVFETWRDDMPPADGSPARGGSTSVRGRVRSPHAAKLQAASVPVA